MTAFPRHEHDHGHCVADALARAEGICLAAGAKLTPQRREVLELIWRSHRPVGAYDLLAQMNADGRRVAPPTVYRALDFLMEHGLVHRIASQNAFIGCPEPGHDAGREILICRACGQASEGDDRAGVDLIAERAQRQGFRVERLTVEAVGLCAACQAAAR